MISYQPAASTLPEADVGANLGCDLGLASYRFFPAIHVLLSIPILAGDGRRTP